MPLFSCLAQAQQPCVQAPVGLAYAPVASVRIDNDLFASRDSGYTSGFQLGLIYPDIDEASAKACVRPSIAWLNDKLSWMHADGWNHELFVRLSQGIYTPVDSTRTDVIPDDRPYAGLLTFAAGVNARQDNQLRSTALVVGVVGPLSLARQTQDTVHKLVGAHHFEGWNNQLRDEVVAMVVHERYQRVFAVKPQFVPLQWDVISRWGGTLGTIQTQANTGLEIRLGHRLPENFGSNPIERAGENRVVASRPSSGWTAHVFGSVEGRAVLRDITLDGNTFVDSHSVNKKTWVGEAAVGIAVTYNQWHITFARAFRTREFDGQTVLPSFGGFTISHPL